MILMMMAEVCELVSVQSGGRMVMVVVVVVRLRVEVVLLVRALRERLLLLMVVVVVVVLLVVLKHWRHGQGHLRVLLLLMLSAEQCTGARR